MNLKNKKIILIIGGILAFFTFGIIVFYSFFLKDSLHFTRGNTAFNEENYILAIDEFSKAIEEDKKSKYLFARCKAYKATFDFTKAYSDCYDGIENWNNFDGKSALNNAYIDVVDLNLDITDSEEIMSIGVEPNLENNVYGYQSRYISLKQLAQNKGVSTNFLILGDAIHNYNFGNFDESLKFYNNYFENNEGNLENIYTWGILNFLKGNFEKSEKIMDDFSKKCGNNCKIDETYTSSMMKFRALLGFLKTENPEDRLSFIAEINLGNSQELDDFEIYFLGMHLLEKYFIIEDGGMNQGIGKLRTADFYAGKGYFDEYEILISEFMDNKDFDSPLGEKYLKITDFAINNFYH